MVRAGFASDKKAALALYKTTESGQCTAGLILAAYGSQPIPGAVSTDVIQKAMEFGAHYIQKAMSNLLDKDNTDLEYAKKLLENHLSKLNDSMAYITRHTGQAIYLSGAVCYIVENKAICLPFGNTYACVWFDGRARQLRNKALPENADEQYIRDAIGGMKKWVGICDEADLPVGAQLLCMTQKPPDSLLPSLMSELIHTNQVVLPVSIYKGLQRTGIPLAVLDIAQTADYNTSPKEGAKQDAQQTTEKA